jgi:hypothetical protein
MERVGAWVDTEGRTGLSLLASAKETDLPVRSSVPAKTEGVATIVEAQPSGGLGWTVVRWLLAGLLVLLLVESYLFHRRAVY